MEEEPMDVHRISCIRKMVWGLLRQDNWVIWSVGGGKSFPRGKGQAGRQQLTGGHCHSFLSPLTCAVRSAYRTAEHQGLLQVITSYIQHGAVSSGRGLGTEVHD